MNFFKNSRTYSFGLMLAVGGILISLVQAGALAHKQSPGFSQADPATPSAEAVKTARPENEPPKEESVTALALETKLFTPDVGNQTFGESVAISGNTAIVGESSATIGSHLGQGAAYIYILSGGIWTLQQKISGETTDRGFGMSVAINGDTAVVGRISNTDPNVLFSGAAYVFIRTGTVWTLQQKLTASDPRLDGNGNRFGASVALDNDTVVVGSPDALVSLPQGLKEGAAYIYTRSGNIWSEQQKIFTPDFVPLNGNRTFGKAVAISANTVVVGEVEGSSPSTAGGAAYFFTRNGTTWTRQQEVTASDGTSGNGFSWSVAINGDTAIIGALRLNDVNQSRINLGSAYVLTRSGTTWTEQQKLIPSDGVTQIDGRQRGFGRSVSMSGNAAIIGAYADALGRGSAYIFTSTGTTWTPQQKLIPSDGTTNGVFGTSVGISGNTAIIGAPNNTTDPTFQIIPGEAYIFTDLTPTPTPPTVQFSASSYSVGEGDLRVNITVTRSGNTTGASAINFATIDDAGLQNCNVFNGIASPRCDYEAVVGSLQFAAGETSKSFSVATSDDSYAEGNETFRVSLSNPSGATLGAPNIATVTIMDNETTAGPNPIDNTNFFVRQQYLDFLMREPDPMGAQWVSMINNCAPGDTSCDRVHASEAFFRSQEFQERGYFVYRFYSTAFGRKPDYAEFVPDLARLSGFLTNAELEAAKVAFIADFMARPAFASQYNSLSNQNYVDTLINMAQVNLSNRQALIDGLNNSTLTRAQVLRQIVESTEVSTKYFNQAFVVMEYFGYLRRQPDALYLTWIQFLDTGASSRTMVTGFVNSAEYRQRFGP